jgi:hypothetical protein
MMAVLFDLDCLICKAGDGGETVFCHAWLLVLLVLSFDLTEGSTKPMRVANAVD